MNDKEFIKKYCVIAYPECDEGYLPRKETTVEARDKTEAWYKASRLFPEYHEIGIYEVKE
jgi:hypothetical protein